MRLLSLFLSLFLMTFSSMAYAHGSGKDLLFVNEDGIEKNISFDEIKELPQHIVKTKTPWHEGEQVFEGPLLRDVVALFGVDLKGINAIALNDFSANIPKNDYINYNMILAWKHNGKEMSRRELGPYFVVYPYDDNEELQDKIYYSRSVWQVVKIKPQKFEE